LRHYLNITLSRLYIENLSLYANFKEKYIKKKKIKKKKKEQNKGYITFVILIIAILGFILAGGFSSFTKNVPLTAKYLLLTPTSGQSQSKNTLQLQTLQFNSITYTPAPTPTPSSNQGSEGNSNAVVGAFAEQLLDSIVSSCGRIITANDVPCLQKLPFSQQVDYDLWYSAFHDATLQCVGFARAVSAGVGDDFGSRDASLFVGNSYPPHWHWIWNTGNATLQVGDIPVWSAGGQHIAVVIKMLGTFNFLVAEANGGSGLVDKYAYCLRGNYCFLGGPQGWLRYE
jgi:hypothetical protein